MKKTAILEKGCIGKMEVKGVRYITKKNFKMGGGIGGEMVNRRAVLGGSTVALSKYKPKC